MSRSLFESRVCDLACAAVIVSGALYLGIHIVAAWMRFLLRRDERGGTYRISDPLGERLAALAAEMGENAPALATALFGVSEIFDPALSGNAIFRAHVVAALDIMLTRGVRAALAD